MLVKGDFHIHTVYSDGKPTPLQVVKRCLASGLLVLSITDHDTFAGSAAALREVKDRGLGLVVVPGAEIRSNEGEVLVYCPEPLTKLTKDISELIDLAHDSGCFVVAAHPFGILGSGLGNRVYSVNIDGIEVFNATVPMRGNAKALRAALALGKTRFANSDAHILEFVGWTWNELEVDDLDVDSVMEAFRRGLVKPHPRYPPLRLYAKRISWGVERRVKTFLRRITTVTGRRASAARPLRVRRLEAE